MICGELMKTKFPTVSPTDNAFDVGMGMEEASLGTVFVLENDKFLGVMSKETFVAKIDLKSEVSPKKLLVKDLMESDIRTVDIGDDISRAVGGLAYQKNFINVLPVTENQRMVGVIDKKFFTQIFADEYIGKYKVSDLMHYNPLTVFDYSEFDKVLSEMMSYSTKRVMVMSGDTLAGVISIHDISLQIFENIKKTSLRENKTTICAKDIMTADPLTVTGSYDAANAAKIMLEGGFGGIPVVNDKLEGVFCRSDVLKAFELEYNLI